MVQRVAFLHWIGQGNQAEYEQAHAPGNLWPEVVEDVKSAGMHNYTGFIGGPDGRLVIGYFETPDLARATAHLARSEVNARWSQRIVPLMETGGDLTNDSMEYMRPIWRIE